jgi:hypothetical protein
LPAEGMNLCRNPRVLKNEALCLKNGIRMS